MSPIALNVVEILVRAKDETGAAFAEADASSRGMSKALLTTAAVGGAALAAIGYESLKMATNFQSSMEKLVTQAGVPQPALKGLSSGVLQLAGQVGFSPDSLSESLYHVASNMASLGASAPKMLGVVKVAAEGAKVGGADLVDVTNALTAAVASGIPGVKNYSQAMGMLNATVGAGDMKMQDLADAFGSGMVATVKGFGLSLKDVGAALATFGDNNIRGAHAGTQLRMSVMALAAPATAGAAQLKAWGDSSDKLATDMRTGGLMKALTDLHGLFIKNGVTAKKQGEVITNMFGKKAGAGLNVLMDQLDRLKSKYPAIAKGAKDFGSAWAKTNDTLKQKLSELSGKFDAVMISIGDKLLPVATRLASFVMSTLIPAIGKVVSWLARHRDVVIAVAAGIAAVLVPALVAWAISAGAAAIATIAAAAPLILIAAGVALVVFAILNLAKHWKQVWHDLKAWAEDAWHFIDDDVIHPIERGIGDLVSWISKHWKILATILATVLLGPIAGLVVFIATHWHEITSLTGRLIGDVVHFFEQLPGKIMNMLSNLPGMMFRAGANVIRHLIDGITSMFGAVGSTMGNLASKVAGFFGLSPAKEGPLSGGGAPEIRGRHFAEAFAQGLTAGLPSLGSAASHLASRAGDLTAGGFGSGGGGSGQWMEARLELRPGGPAFMNELMEEAKLWVRIHGGGGPDSAQRALGQG